MTYKGYEGVVEFDEEAGIFSGEVINTRDVITFQGASVPQLTKAFHNSVDDYLEFCASRNEEPEKPFSGTLSLRLPPQMHRELALEARRLGKSLNTYIVDRLRPKTMTAGRP
jgi:predicted HicB family RNase H-like nuclease